MADKIGSTFKRLDNGNIEVIFTVTGDLILQEKAHTLEEFSKDAVISGFRKGKAPITKVEELTSEEKLTEHILSHILPKAFTDAVQEHTHNPAPYPKSEAIKVTSTKNVAKETVWEIKATTCELPKVILPKDLKKKLKHDDKDQNVLMRSLIAAVNLDIPKLLIEEEVNGRLSQVLERIEKLGLTLEGYLKSVGKTPEILRSEYEVQAKDAISTELILNEVATEEKVEVSETQIDEFIKSTGEDVTKASKDQREVLKRVLMRRAALEKLTK